MKRIKFLLLILFVLILTFNSEAKEKSFPKKPIKILVYTGPGGLIDITARKFATIASKYTDATFVVENKPGSGGIVAIKRLLQEPADGYTLFAGTKSNISKIVASGVDTYINAIDWAALMLSDHECVITNKNNPINTWQQIVEDAKEKNGNQLWLGPAKGGLDHVTALKIWDKAGIKAKWIPFKSGGKAKAALLGKQGVAYVGNPGEVLGNDNLKIAAICAPKRLPQFPDAPIFKEFGVNGVENEVMWRGFMLKKGIPQKIRDWYDDLFKKVANDPEWKDYWQRNGIETTFYGSDKFSKIVLNDKKQFEYYLKKIGIIKNIQKSKIGEFVGSKGFHIFLFLIIIIYIAIGFLTYFSKLRYKFGRIMIPLFFIFLSIIFYLITYSFPVNEKVGPSVVPRLWIAFIIPLSLYLLFDILRKDKENIEIPKGDIPIVWKFFLLLVVYLISMIYIGYFISSFLFVFFAMLLLGYKKYSTMVLISAGWIVFSYFVFYRMLFVPLPTGKFIELLLR